jgi:hypothetical protein
MRFRHTLFLFLLLVTVSAEAFELIMIQAISDSRRTFITRNGKRQGHIVGMTGTFTAEDISVLAKAINVTGNYTQWQLLNVDAILPFEKGALVTYYPANEYIWALSPESERRKYIKSQVPKVQQSWVFKGALTRGLSESVSDAPANSSRRGGFLGEIYYEKDIVPRLAVDLGFRYERETVTYPGSSFLTVRNLLMADVLYYFDQWQDLLNGRLFISIGAGFGLSNTSTVGLQQSGPVGLLPTAKMGLSMPFNDEYEFILDGAFESLQTREEQMDGRKQTTTQTNFKMGFGLRKFF